MGFRTRCHEFAPQMSCVWTKLVVVGIVGLFGISGLVAGQAHAAESGMVRPGYETISKATCGFVALHFDGRDSGVTTFGNAGVSFDVDTLTPALLPSSDEHAFFPTDHLIVAQKHNALAARLADDEFAASLVQFTTSAAHGLVGELLTIRLINETRADLEVPNVDSESDFANIRFAAKSIPERANVAVVLAMVGVAMVIMPASRRRG